MHGEVAWANGRAEDGVVMRMVVEEGWRKLKGGRRDLGKSDIAMGGGSLTKQYLACTRGPRASRPHQSMFNNNSEWQIQCQFPDLNAN